MRRKIDKDKRKVSEGKKVVRYEANREKQDKTRQLCISLGLRPLESGEHCTLSFPAYIYSAWSKQTI